LLPSYLEDYPLLISEDVFQLKPFEEALNFYLSKLSIKPRIIMMKKRCSYIVKDLVYINTPNNLPFNLIGNAKFKASYVTIDNRSIDYLRNSCINAIIDRPSKYLRFKKIFLYRNNCRRNYNQEEILRYLEAYEFTRLNLSELSFLDQVQVFYNADYIFGPTGAEWANLVFAKKGAKALCWMAEEAGDFSVFSTIAGIVDVNLKYVTYSADVKSTESLYSSKYHLDLNKIESIIKEFNFCKLDPVVYSSKS
jgi:hypothetical protein